MAVTIKLSDDDDKKSKKPKFKDDDLAQILIDDLGSESIHPKSKIDDLIANPLKPNKPTTLQKLKANFKNLCEKESSLGENYNTGMYLSIESLETMIKDIQNDNSEVKHIHVGFGLRRAKIIPGNEQADVPDNVDWNCIHLIFQGANPVAEVGKAPTIKSSLVFSTYDGGENGYIGAKPGTPPFTEPEQ